MQTETKKKAPLYYGILLAISIALLGISSFYNYLLFHSLVELFSILVAFGIFVLAWQSRRLAENSYLMLLGITYLFVGGFDLIHTLSYKGMGVFPAKGTDFPTQLWIAA